MHAGSPAPLLIRSKSKKSSLTSESPGLVQIPHRCEVGGDKLLLAWDVASLAWGFMGTNFREGKESDGLHPTAHRGKSPPIRGDVLGGSKEGETLVLSTIADEGLRPNSKIFEMLL